MSTNYWEIWRDTQFGDSGSVPGLLCTLRSLELERKEDQATRDMRPRIPLKYESWFWAWLLLSVSGYGGSRISLSISKLPWAVFVSPQTSTTTNHGPFNTNPPQSMPLSLISSIYKAINNPTSFTRLSCFLWFWGSLLTFLILFFFLFCLQVLCFSVWDFEIFYMIMDQYLTFWLFQVISAGSCM